MEVVVPRPLQVGDRVAVTAASGPPEAERLERGVQVLRGWGLEVDILPSCSAPAEPFDYLAGADAQRARDLEQALTDPAYAAVVLAKGGYGAQRTLEHLDWRAVQAARPAPRHVVGFSDVTALQEAVLCRLGWTSLYAAMPATWYLQQERAAESLRAQLFTPDSARLLTFADGDPIVPGTAEGVVLGGCATLLSSSLGTDCSIPAAGSILFLEDVDEELFRLDRVFTQLRRAGYLEGVKAVLTGTFDECGAPADVRCLIVDRFGDLGVPVLAGADIGHGIALQALPIGQRARLDVDARTLSYTT